MSQVLTFNGGSSSIRFSICEGVDARKLLVGKIERMGTPDACLTVDDRRHDETPPRQIKLQGDEQRSAGAFALDWLAAQGMLDSIGAVGHRVVHGMHHSEPVQVTDSLLRELKGFMPYDPEHLPTELALIGLARERLPAVPQVVCFDTAFHQSMPQRAKLLAIPRRYLAKGVRRYGFHGLSYTFLMAELERLGDPGASQGRVILAHLGNGASLAAVRNGRSVDTSMGFTPSSGLVMSTRSGDTDPGLVSFLAATESIDPGRFNNLMSHESGLLGISETSSDIRDLLQRELEDERAADALGVFCYQIKKWIGGFAAALEGLDTLVFSGGIGENSAVIRARVCEGLEFLGIHLDKSANEAGAAVVSSARSGAAVRVIRTDEEWVIATSTMRVLSRMRNE